MVPAKKIIKYQRGIYQLLNELTFSIPARTNEEHSFSNLLQTHITKAGYELVPATQADVLIVSTVVIVLSENAGYEHCSAQVNVQIRNKFGTILRGLQKKSKATSSIKGAACRKAITKTATFIGKDLSQNILFYLAD